MSHSWIWWRKSFPWVTHGIFFYSTSFSPWPWGSPRKTRIKRRHGCQFVTDMSRNAWTRSQVLSVYYNFTPFHARFLNVLLSMGIKIHRALATKHVPEAHNAPADSVMNSNLSTNCRLWKAVVKPSFGLSISALFILALASLYRHTNIWTSGWNWMDQPTS